MMFNALLYIFTRKIMPRGWRARGASPPPTPPWLAPRARHPRLSMTPLHLRRFSQDELKRDHDLTEHVQGLEQGAAARRASERKQSLLQHRKMLQERWLQDEQEEQELQAQRPPWRGRSARQRLTLTPKP